MIGRRLASDRALAPDYREGFLEVHRLAESLKLSQTDTHKAHVARSFAVLCEACQNARLYPCHGTEAEQEYCPLIREYSQ